MSESVDLVMWGFCHLVVFWRCICKKCLFFASIVRHPIDQLSVILAWVYHPEKCVVGVLLGGVEVGSEILWVWLLVWKAGPSFMEAVSMLIELPVGETNL